MPLHRKPLPPSANVRLETVTLSAAKPATLEDTCIEKVRSDFHQLGLNKPYLQDEILSSSIVSPPKHTNIHAADVPLSWRAEDSIPHPITREETYSLSEAERIDSLATTISSDPFNASTTAHGSTHGSNPNSSQQPLQGGRSERKLKLASVLQDASLFLGGLIKHPTESTKHFTILRHSHGLVYYKGPTTSIAFTTFSDCPLPSDRRYWFQMKGWTGHAGMRAKAFMRSNGNWINVTPVAEVNASELPSTDERAWQRDIKKFQDKAPKALRKHMVRETIVIRVPFEAVDGYFRIVLTGGDSRWPLCPSPVFRVASTSMSAASIKGASLSTLPIELSISILQYAATTVTSNFVVPFAETARSQIASALPSAVSSYGQTAYGLSGAQDQVDTMNQEYDEQRDLIFEQSSEGGRQYVPMSRLDVVGDEQGPESPFPIRFDSKVVRGSGIGLREVGMPTANLTDAPADAIATLDGVYFGWVLVTPKDKAQRELHSEWRHAIITITYDHAKTSIAVKKIVRAYVIHDYGTEDFYDAKMSLVLMGYLRPVVSYKHKQAFFTETMRDIEITRTSLDREFWSPMPTLQKMKTARSERSITDRYVDSRMAVQRQIDKAPVHLIGIRNQSSGLNDRGLYGRGGLYVVRDEPQIL